MTDPREEVLALLLFREGREMARPLVRLEWFDGLARTAVASAIEWESNHEVDEDLELIGWARDIARRSQTDFVTVCHWLGPILTDSGFAAKNVHAWLRLCREDWERTQLGRVAAHISEAAADPSQRPSDLAGTLRSVSDVLGRRFADADVSLGPELEAESRRVLSGSCRFGFAELDEIAGPLEPGHLVTVAGRTSIGKTTFALSVLANETANGIPAGIVSLEMTPHALWERLRATSSAPLERVRCWYPGEKATASEIGGRIGRWRASGIGLVVVDHLQLIRPEHAGRSRYEALTEIVHDMKRLARQHQVALILLSQLSREVTKREDKRPNLSDLRDSGAIEEDSDLVVMLHREGYYNPLKDQRSASAFVSKNRNGRCGEAKLEWDTRLGIFREPRLEVQP